MAAIVSIGSTLSCIHAGESSQRINPAHLATILRDPIQTNDFLRIMFLPPKTSVTTLGKPGTALRVFFSPSQMFSPPVSLEEAVGYLGLVDQSDRGLFILRCKPPNSVTDPVLATWPQVFALLKTDLMHKVDCAHQGRNVEDRLFCAAQRFEDIPQGSASASIENTFLAVANLVGDRNSPEADWLKTHYGISAAFDGVGYSVKDSYSLDNSNPATSEQVLQRSIVSEYLLRNTSVQDAGCRCISVEPYSSRKHDPLDPEFVWRMGGQGNCREVARLKTDRHR
jgi:hypothetical protein